MTIQTQRNNIIQQIQLIDDKDLLTTIQTVLEYGVKKSNSKVISLEEQKRVLKIKAKNTEENYIDAQTVNNLFDSP